MDRIVRTRFLGLTLIEVVVAAAILLMFSATVMTAFVAAQQASQDLGARQQAKILAQDLMTEIAALPNFEDSAGDGWGNFADDCIPCPAGVPATDCSKHFGGCQAMAPYLEARETFCSENPYCRNDVEPGENVCTVRRSCFDDKTDFAGYRDGYGLIEGSRGGGPQEPILANLFLRRDGKILKLGLSDERALPMRRAVDVQLVWDVDDDQDSQTWIHGVLVTITIYRVDPQGEQPIYEMQRLFTDPMRKGP